MKEFERKCLLNKQQYLFCLEALSKITIPTVFTQINYYYDTDDFFLAQKGVTLRVRQIEDSLNLEYKSNQKSVDDIRICDEYSKEIDCLPKTISGFQDNTGIYKNIGILITQRTNFETDGFIISLDKNYYLGCLDYEIEIESTDIVDLPDLINKLNINFSSDTPGKYRRFINKIKSQKDTL